MARAIDADELLKKFAYSPEDTEDEQVFNAAARKIIREMPTLTPQNEPLPVLVNDEPDREFVDYICPRCKDIISQRRRGQRMETVYQCKYHDTCGQRVDWSDPQPVPPPAGGRGGRMMDIEKLIERLRSHRGAFFEALYKQDMDDAATTLSTLQTENEKLKDQLYDGEGTNLVEYWMQQAKIEENGHRNCQAENEKLRAELEKVKRALAMMWFAYVNSDKETPHSYETEALEEAERILGPWAECMPKYLRRGPQKED